MSHTLYTADNISVKGYHYTVDTVQSIKDAHKYDKYTRSWPEKTWDRSWPKLHNWVWSALEKYKDEIVEENAIHFDFTILINWKLKTFGWSFIVIPNENWEYWEFEDWTTWNAIYFTLKSLWYKIEDSEYLFGQEQAQTWINEVMAHNI